MDDLNISNTTPESAQAAQTPEEDAQEQVLKTEKAWNYMHGRGFITNAEYDAQLAEKEKAEKIGNDNRSLNDSTLSGMRDRSRTLADYGLRPSHKH